MTDSCDENVTYCSNANVGCFCKCALLMFIALHMSRKISKILTLILNQNRLQVATGL